MLINNVTRSAIFRRAWQLKRRTASNSFGDCLRKAWSEARNSQFADWSHLPASVRFPVPAKTIEQLELEIMMLNMKDRWNDCDYEEMRTMQRQLDQLQQVAA